MELSELQRINLVAATMLKGEPINEGYNEKDREAKSELMDYFRHHSQMINRHNDVSRGETKCKELSKHDLAGIAHQFAFEHFNRLNGNGFNRGGLPEDYHQDRDFYDKLNGLVSKRADGKSKDCGVSTDTSK